MSRWLCDLNPEQQQAVQTVEGPLLVLAGAGSGKTRVITRRIAYLMDQGVDASNILGVTFTNKAAEELKQRLVRMVGPNAKNLALSTFHALGLMMLKSERKQGARGGRFTIFDTSDQLAVLRELTQKIHFERAFDLGSILSRISSYKNDFLQPDEVKYKEDDPYAEAAAILYPRYCEALEAYAAVDFDDLVCAPTRMIEKSAAWHSRWSGRFRYILVDEYQDTNAAQLRMLRALLGTNKNICVVGDDDQAIYGWRGADVRNILCFTDHFPGAKVVYLQRNYRSVGQVIAAANAVVAEGKNRHPKQLIATREVGEKVRLVIAPDEERESSWVAGHIRRAIDSGSFRPSNIAVLYRSNILSRGMETELREQGIPYRVLGGTAVFDRRDVKDLLAYLRVCMNPADEISLRRIINSPPRGIGPKTVVRLAEYAQTNNKPFYWALSHVEAALPKGDRAINAVAGFNELIKRAQAQLRHSADLGQNVRALLDMIELRPWVEKTSTSGKQLMRRWESVEAVVSGAARFAERNPEAGISGYLSRVALTSSDDSPSGDTHDESVTLSTLHGVKGLEFGLVVLIGAEEGLLPHDRTVNPHERDHISSDIDEERRLCYVGMTRAMDELVITRTLERAIRGRRQPRVPSRFLEAIPTDMLEVEDLGEPPPMEDVKSMMADLRAVLGG